jgi:hypothetical protein
MADVKISGLPASTTPLAGTEVLPIVQGGVTKQVSVANLTDGRNVTVGAGTALLPAITTSGDPNTGIFFPAADTIAFTEGGVEAMRLNSSGFVGIGTNNPTTKLHTSLFGGVSTTIDRRGDFGQSLQLVRDGVAGNVGFGLANDNTLGVYTANVERMRVFASGGVSIGNTTDPGNTNLSVTGAIYANNSFSSATPAYSFNGLSGNGFSSASTTIRVATGGVFTTSLNANGVSVSSTGRFAISGDGNPDGADTILIRDAAGTFAQRNGANAQAFRLYNTFTSSTNYERVSLYANSNVFYLSSEAQTGTLRPLVVVLAPATTSTLPAASAALTGARAFVTDANANTFGTAYATGGANKVPVYCDGTAWYIG